MKSLTKPPLLITEASLEAANRGWAPLRSRGELPHLYKSGGTYFVTFRLWAAAFSRAARFDIQARAQRVLEWMTQKMDAHPQTAPSERAESNAAIST